MTLAAALCCLIHGRVQTRSGLPVAGAAFTVLDGRSEDHTISDARGDFSIRVNPGSVIVVVVAQGFKSAEIGPMRVAGDETLDITLVTADTAALRTIATATVNGAQTNVYQFVPSVDVTRSQLDQMGFSTVTQGLADIPSVTFARPDGGASTAPVPVALRGPDPSETLVTLDGQVLNNGNTGDLDVSQLPVSAFSAIEVSEGLGPIDSEGSNTFGGAVNLLSLQPTFRPHAAASYSIGSFGRSEGWVNVTGMSGPFGYAIDLDNTQEHGYVDQSAILCTGGFTTTCVKPVPEHLGSTISARTMLLNLLYNVSQRADVGFRVFTLGDARDMSGTENAPVHPADQGPGAFFQGPGEATLDQILRAYDLHARLPLGAGTVLADASLDDDGIGFNGSGISPYDVSHVDRRQNLSLSWVRDADDYSMAFGGYVRHESLAGDFIGTTLAQDIDSFFARGSFSPIERVHLEGGIFLSDYSTFGTSLDGRFGVAYDVSRGAAVHVSVGTGFRAPLLVERFVFPLAALARDPNGVYLGQGNPAENPERATEYELGFSQRLADTQLDVSLYRSNLRNPIENFYPLAKATSGGCVSGSPPCFEYPINVGNAVYQGLELRLVQRFLQTFTLRASYGINIAYPENLPATVSNPTSGGSLVNGEQFLNIPPQQASLGIDWTDGAWHAGIDGFYRGRNNELNAPPFSVLDAAVGHRFGSVDLTVAGTNLTSAQSGKFTLLGQGVPYSGVSGPIATDLYALEPAAVRAIVTFRR